VGDSARLHELAVYRRVLEVMPPVLHRWALKAFYDSTQWFESRLLYVRSLAAWSMVGYIVGLGDRHSENVLVDVSSGELVHVDFDYLFEKGRTLAKPELVPFRLTPNLIDACGVVGVEGPMRRCSEVTLRVLRENCATLMSVLDTFVHDPLVDWRDTLPVTMLLGVRLRLQGRVADAENLAKSLSDRSVKPQFVGSGTSLSVEGQVHHLIHSATDPKLLAQMYVGWQPFL
jgi:serine/threonine-protein kinase ATR